MPSKPGRRTVPDRDVTVDDIEREHLDQVDPRAHWLYLAAVLGGGTLLMLGLIAWLGAVSG
jgi:hypothetical protein